MCKKHPLMTQAANVKYANVGNMHSAPAYYLSLSLSLSLFLRGQAPQHA